MALPLTASFPQSGSIISRWKLDEASGARADSVGSNTLTDNGTGGVASASGQFSANAADFESTDSDYLAITDIAHTGLDFTGNFTFAVWMKFESLPSGSEMSYFSKWGSIAANESYILAYQDVAGTKSFRYVLENSSAATTIGTANYSASTATWYHVCISVATTTPAATLYINGVSQGAFSNSSSSATSIRNGGADFNLGRRASASNYYDGMMQDGVLWSLALSSGEVTTLYNSYFPAAFTSTRLPLLGVG